MTFYMNKKITSLVVDLHLRIFSRTSHSIHLMIHAQAAFVSMFLPSFKLTLSTVVVSTRFPASYLRCEPLQREAPSNRCPDVPTESIIRFLYVQNQRCAIKVHLLVLSTCAPGFYLSCYCEFPRHKTPPTQEQYAVTHNESFM